jgi:hypothetical protein
MDITEILTATVAGFTGVAGTIVTFAPKLAAARKAIAPLLGRKRLKVVVLVERDRLQPAQAFAESLRSSGGFQDVVVTASPHAAVGAKAVIVWHPSVEVAPSMCSTAVDAAPDATQLVLTHERLTLVLNEKRLLANSEIRLRGDLAVLAEVAG